MKNYLVISIILLIAACSKNDEKQAKSELSPFELENGIGPVRSKLNLPDTINKSMALLGKNVFETKCISCHFLDKGIQAPALRGVTKMRTNEYIMNKMLNPDEMMKRHPASQEMFLKYMNRMTFQDISYADARNMLEYFRASANSQ